LTEAVEEQNSSLISEPSLTSLGEKVMSKNAGFTLIELIAVLLILAILAVVAVPQFVDLREEAAQAAVDGVAGGLASASALNYASRSMKGNVAGENAPVANCTAVGSLLRGGLNAKYTITAAVVAPGATVTCTVTGERSKTATFPAIGIN
jgi:MSHA pilin protein MshA